MPRKIREMIQAATAKQIAAVVGLAIAALIPALLAAGRTAADHGVRNLPTIQSFEARLAAVESTQKIDRARADSAVLADLQFKGAMLEVIPGLRDQVRALADSNEAAARRQAENMALLRRLGGTPR